VLFDIDETMISSDGAGRRAISRVLKEHHQIEPQHMNVLMSGKTDPQILTEIMTASGMPAHEITASIPKVIENYLGLLEEEIAASKYYIVHDGVYILLEAIAAHPQMYLGLLTGNVERGARMKLDHFDLNKHFELGAYGSDSANRLDLPAVAVERALQLFNISFRPEEVVIIGDSVNDVLCAKGYNAKCIAVNTGKTSWEDLQATNPEYLFKSLSNTQAVMDAILAPMPLSSSTN
jgi:phosphoglycolate phosphatase-like HAD superfamily hydrolase